MPNVLLKLKKEELQINYALRKIWGPEAPNAEHIPSEHVIASSQPKLNLISNEVHQPSENYLKFSSATLVKPESLYMAREKEFVRNGSRPTSSTAG